MSKCDLCDDGTWAIGQNSMARYLYNVQLEGGRIEYDELILQSIAVIFTVYVMPVSDSFHTPSL